MEPGNKQQQLQQQQQQQQQQQTNKQTKTLSCLESAIDFLPHFI